MRHIPVLALCYTILYFMIVFTTWHFWSVVEMVNYLGAATPSKRFDWMVVIMTFTAIPIIFNSVYSSLKSHR